jgi:lipopolysaccharide export system protein LptA
MVINGESIREVSGNVILTQGNVKVTCNKAIQYIARNDAELIGNVVVTQDSLTIKTDRGFYFGNLRKTTSNSGVILDDKKVILTAKEGEYLFDQHKAIFKNEVKLFDTVSTLTSDDLTYYRNDDIAVAVGKVKIVDPENTIYADSLIHNRKEQKSLAFNNVLIINSTNNIFVFGNQLLDNRLKKFSIIYQQPLLIQIDTVITKSEDDVESIFFDTLFISANKMEIFRDGNNMFVASDSVEIIRELFSSINDITIYFRDSSKIVSYKKSELHKQPVIWYSNSQLTADSITIYLKENKIIQLDSDGSTFMLTQNQTYPERFDQSSCSSAKIFFEDNKVSRVEYFDNVFSIYFMFEENKPNGLIKTNSKEAVIYFSDNEVNDVKLHGNPGTEYYPENLVEGKEKNYLLPKFNLIESRPSKEKMYEKLSKFKWHKH